VSEVVEVGAVKHEVLAQEGTRLGLTCVRGRWIPVIELAGSFPDTPNLDPNADSTFLLVLGGVKGQLGLRVEDFGEVVEVQGGSLAREGGRERQVDVNGELIRFVDPATLLASRADLLSDKGDYMEEIKTAPKSTQVVTFFLSEEEFGIDVMKVFEVLKIPEPDFIEGVIGLRDSFVPVIDMRKRFNLPHSEGDGAGRVLVVQTGDSPVALVVDDVPGVVELPLDAISPAPEFFKGLAGRYLDGVAESGDRLIILLNLDEVLSSKERIALEKMAKTPRKKSAGRKSKKASGKKK
jgi:purine-binding chemotaxis protein CheW